MNEKKTTADLDRTRAALVEAGDAYVAAIEAWARAARFRVDCILASRDVNNIGNDFKKLAFDRKEKGFKPGSGPAWTGFAAP